MQFLFFYCPKTPGLHPWTPLGAYSGPLTPGLIRAALCASPHVAAALRTFQTFLEKHILIPDIEQLPHSRLQMALSWRKKHVCHTYDLSPKQLPIVCVRMAV